MGCIAVIPSTSSEFTDYQIILLWYIYFSSVCSFQKFCRVPWKGSQSSARSVPTQDNRIQNVTKKYIESSRGIRTRGPYVRVVQDCKGLRMYNNYILTTSTGFIHENYAVSDSEHWFSIIKSSSVEKIFRKMLASQFQTLRLTKYCSYVPSSLHTRSPLWSPTCL
jgi:hypothetical protein